MILALIEGYFFFLGKECYKTENFDSGKVYLPARSKFKLGGTTHFEIVATNCDKPGFEGLPEIRKEDTGKLFEKLDKQIQLHLGEQFRPDIRTCTEKQNSQYIDLSSF